MNKSIYIHVVEAKNVPNLYFGYIMDEATGEQVMELLFANTEDKTCSVQIAVTASCEEEALSLIIGDIRSGKIEIMPEANYVGK